MLNNNISTLCACTKVIIYVFFFCTFYTSGCVWYIYTYVCVCVSVWNRQHIKLAHANSIYDAIFIPNARDIFCFKRVMAKRAAFPAVGTDRPAAPFIGCAAVELSVARTRSTNAFWNKGKTPRRRWHRTMAGNVDLANDDGLSPCIVELMDAFSLGIFIWIQTTWNKKNIGIYGRMIKEN